MNPLRVGVVGLGVISRFYLAALERLPDVRTAAVCDPDTAALAPWDGRVPCYRDHREMLDDAGSSGRLDAVVVTAPNDAHAPIARAALETGLPVCVEKPLATTPAQARELAAYARERGTVLFTAFHRRYNTEVELLYDRCWSGPPITGVTVRYLESIEEHAGTDSWYLDPARCGGGCVADNGPNAFDLVCRFLGPVEVVGADVTRDAAGTDRAARVRLSSAAGAMATVVLDWAYPGECKDVTARLADGTEHRADMLAGYPGFKNSLWHEYVAIVGEFARTAAGPGAAHPVDEDPGVAAIELVAGTYRSADSSPEGVRAGRNG